MLVLFCVFLLLLTFKVLGLVTWSWLVITLPLWIAVALVAAGAVVSWWLARRAARVLQQHQVVINAHMSGAQDQLQALAQSFHDEFARVRQRSDRDRR